MTTPRPGWYPDPAGTETGQQPHFRYWNGSSWTDDIGRSSSAPAPNPAAEPVSEPSPDPRGKATDLADTAPHSTRVRAVVALTLGVALLITTGFGGSWLLREDTQESRQPQAPGTAQNTPRSDATTAPMGRVDEETGEARIGKISMMLPGDPYEVFAGSTSVKDAFDIVFTSNAPVHRNYHGSSDWVATVGLAHISPAVTAGDNPDAAGKAAMLAVTRHFFGTHQTQLKNLKTSIGTVAGGAGGRQPAVTATVDVHYAIKHLRSTHDQVTVKLVRLDNGSLVAGISSVPNDADPAVREQAAAALRTLTVR